jgi:hypothetical protein
MLILCLPVLVRVSQQLDGSVTVLDMLNSGEDLFDVLPIDYGLAVNMVASRSLRYPFPLPSEMTESFPSINMDGGKYTQVAIEGGRLAFGNVSKRMRVWGCEG